MPKSWLRELLDLFPDAGLSIDDFEVIEAAEIPAPYRRLLDHHEHMTVSLEAHHRRPVRLHRLAARRDGSRYARRLFLTAGEDGPRVLSGIMRIDLNAISEPVRRAILEAGAPLGRILIENEVLRRVQSEAYLRVRLRRGPSSLFPGREDAGVAYGRLALIFCDERPAVELLEIVAPDSNDSRQHPE
jgi:hypothetical protein